MKTRGLIVILSFIAAVLVVAFLFVFARQVSPVIHPAAAEEPDRPFEISPRRTITPEIDANLQILKDGQQLQVAGPGSCGTGGITFDVQATVTQDSSGAKAKGRVDWTCRGENTFHWVLLAEALSPRRFEPGPALACAHAVVDFTKDGTVSHQWCREVILSGD